MKGQRAGGRLIGPCLLALGFAAPLWAAPPVAFQVVSDELDPHAATASLPHGPVDQALAELRATSPRAVVLVPRRDGTTGGVRHALAAWRADPAAPEWDALLVLATPEGARLIEVSSTAREVEPTLAALLAHALGSAAPPAAVAGGPADQAPLPIPDRFDVRYLVLFERGTALADPARAKEVVAAHIQYQLRLQHDGRALAAGPLVADEALVGITVLRVKDLATAESIAAGDPAVAAGMLKAKVREWKVPGGRLP